MSRKNSPALVQECEEYWRDVRKHRMPFRNEVTRLVTVLYGMRAQSSEPTQDILDFWASSRPYGNKDIPESIAFNLGWDYQRRLCTEYMPAWVAEEAFKLHEAVRVYLVTGEKPGEQVVHIHLSAG